MKYLYIVLIILPIWGISVGGLLTGCDSGRSAASTQQKQDTQEALKSDGTSAVPSPQNPAPSSLPSTPRALSSLAELFQRAGLSYMGNRGIPAPDFSVKSIEGKQIKLSEFKGKVVLLNFWATWCPPCRAEMPSIETLYQKYKTKATFQILAVSVQEEPSVVKTFLAQNPYSFPIALDPNGEAAQLYGIRGIPTTFIIDRKGTLQGALVGGKDWTTPQVYDLIDALLAN